jgi:hypothetical protein
MMNEVSFSILAHISTLALSTTEVCVISDFHSLTDIKLLRKSECNLHDVDGTDGSRCSEKKK